MESITIKMDKNLAKGMKEAMKEGYSTKTEFIRDAIRFRLDELRKKRALRIINENFGTFKRKTNKTDRQIREEVSKELMKEYGLE